MKCCRRGIRRVSVPRADVFVLLVPLFLTFPAGAQETIRSQSNIVLIPALVKDARGHAVYGLKARDFVVEDDGVAQGAQLDEAAESEPVSLMIVVQCGRSARREFPRIQTLHTMIRPILEQEHSLTAVVTFDSGVHLVQDFTDDENDVEKALTSLDSGDGKAAILDAVKYSLLLLEKQQPGRQRVLLLISETRDHGSHMAKMDEVVTAIGESNTAVYALAFSPALSNVLDTGRGNNIDDMNGGPDLLSPLLMARQALRKNTPKAMSSMTGGEYELFESGRGFEDRMIDFTNHLHSRYLLSFQPKNPHEGLHRLEVRLRDPAQGNVLARRSYWAQNTGQ